MTGLPLAWTGGPLATVSFGPPISVIGPSQGVRTPDYEQRWKRSMTISWSTLQAENPSHITCKNEKRNFRLAYFRVFWFPAGKLEENVWKTINLWRDSSTIGKDRDHVRLGLKRAKKIHGSCVLRQLKRRKGYFKVVMKKLLVSH